MADPSDKPTTRRLTLRVSADLHASLHLAKLYSGKPLYALAEEGLDLIASHYRALRQAERRKTENEQ